MKGFEPLSIVLETIILTIKLHLLLRVAGLEPVTFGTQNQCSTIKLHHEDQGI